MSREQVVPNRFIHHLLGPRTAFVIGSERENGRSHLCAASNVTNISIAPQVMAVALWPTWETTANILRTGELTINLMDRDHIDDIWIVGAKYSGVALETDDDKFVVAGFNPLESSTVRPSGVREASATIECRVVRAVQDIGDHVLFLAEATHATAARQHFDSEFLVDVTRLRPPMQISGNRFAECAPTRTPDTEWCTSLASIRRRASLEGES